MRGDSLRDFYAKALALAGLGALASVGALVDYWPSAVELPRLAGTVAQAAPPAIPRGADLRPVISNTPVFKGPRPTFNIRPIGVTIGDVTEPASVSEPIAAPSAPAVDVAPPAIAPAPDSFDVMPIDEWDLPASVVHLSTPLLASVDLEDHGLPFIPAPVRPVAGAPATSSDGITGVFRKTGSSIATVGVKTGSTIVGAFRAVGGAFRKIL